MDLFNVKLLADDLQKVQNTTSRTKLTASRIKLTNYMDKLLKVVNGDKEFLKLEEGRDGYVDLDDNIVWRQVKVKEKAIQFYEFLLGRPIQAKVIRICSKSLIENNMASNATFSLALIKEGYSQKTTVAQSSQMMTLFKLLKIVDSSGGVCQINPKSLIYRRLKSMYL